MFEFFTFSDANARYVTLGVVALAVATSVVGCFALLRKRALMGDAISHSVLPGLCLAFALSGQKNPVYLLAGATFTGLLSVVINDWLGRVTRLKPETITGVTLSFFFGLGLFWLTIIQKSGAGAQAGLDRFLFGQAAAMLFSDVWLFSVLAAALVGVVALFWKELGVVSFDPQFARVAGLPVRWLEFLLTVLTTLAIVFGVQAVGVILTSAMALTPAIAARFWTHSLRRMAVIAALVGAFSGLAGAYLSFLAPSIPTGPCMVLTAAGAALVSFFVNRKRNAAGFAAKS